MPYPYLIQPNEQQMKALKRMYKVKTVMVHGDMGTGKTKLTIDFIANLVWARKIEKAVVIVPLEAVGVWQQQLSENAPFLTYSLYLNGEEVDWNVNVIIINYDYICPRRKIKRPTARSIAMAKKAGRKLKKKYYIDKSILNSILQWEPSVVCIDEGHKIKRPTARRSKAIHKLGEIAEYTIDLTGTPTGNKKALDLWSQFRFINKNVLDEDFGDFKQRYAVWTGFGGFKFVKCKNLKQLGKIIRPYSIRIKKTGLPEKVAIRYPVLLPKEAQDIYKQMEEEFVAYVDGQHVVASIVLTKMMKLSQIAGGFIRNERKQDLPVHRAKLEALRNILENLMESGTTRVVIFARFLWELAEIRKILDEQGWNTFRVKGRVPLAVQERFNTEGGAMLCQTASGSGSNNFQAANYMIFYSTDYSLINFQQAMDRIHRMGQKHTCFYYFLQAKGTIDNRIYRLLQENKEVANEISALMEEIRNDNMRRS